MGETEIAFPTQNERAFVGAALLRELFGLISRRDPNPGDPKSRVHVLTEYRGPNRVLTEYRSPNRVLTEYRGPLRPFGAHPQKQKKTKAQRKKHFKEKNIFFRLFVKKTAA